MFISYSITPSAVCVNRVCFYIDTLSTFKFNMQLFKFSHLLFRYYFSSFKQLKFYSLELKFYPQNSKRNSNFDILFEFLLCLEPLKERRTYQISPIQYVRLLTRLLIQFSKVNSYLSYACFPASRSALISSTFLGVSL